MLFECEDITNSILKMKATENKYPIKIIVADMMLDRRIKSANFKITIEEVISQLESIYLDTIVNIQEAGDIFERDSVSLLCAIITLKQLAKLNKITIERI